MSQNLWGSKLPWTFGRKLFKTLFTKKVWVQRPSELGWETYLSLHYAIFQNYPGVSWRETLFSWICCRRNIGFEVCFWFLWNSFQLLLLAHPVWLTLYRQTHQHRSDSTWIMYWTLTFLRGTQNNLRISSALDSLDIPSSVDLPNHRMPNLSKH